MMSRQLFVVRNDYPNNVNMRGQVGALKKTYPDGMVLVVFEYGPYKGDKVCMDPKYLEPIS